MNLYFRTGILIRYVNYLPSINSARYTQRIIQTVKSREADIFVRPDTFLHDTGYGSGYVLSEISTRVEVEGVFYVYVMEAIGA